MALFKPLVRNRRLRLVVGLAVAVAIPVGALVLAQYRLVRDLEQTSVMVLETLSKQVADSLAQALREQFERPSYEIERVDHQAIDQQNLPLVMSTLRTGSRSVPMVDAFYLWSVRNGRGGQVLELPNTPGWWESPDAGFVDAGAESPRLIALAREFGASRLPWGTTFQAFDDRAQGIVIHLLFDSSARERVTSFIAFRVDLERLRTEELGTMLLPLVQAVDRKTGLATLVADVIDQDGQEVFRSHPEQALRPTEVRTLPLLFFAPSIMPARDPCEGCLPEWRLRVGYGEGTAAAIAAAATTGHRTLLAVLVTVLALGVLLAVRAALKEMQLVEAKSHFVASVSHDLKTPLALIQLFAETLELGRVRSAERAREYYAIINRESRKLGALIDNVLDFSRIESGLRMYRLQPVDLGRLVRQVVAGFEPHLAHDGFHLRLDIADGVAEVLADEEAVGLAIGNLLSNAMKYAGGTRSIQVSVVQMPFGAAVRVADDGIGIAWRHQRRIFEKFYRVAGEAPDAPRGCGLGLAIVDHVMRAHRGRVLVESEPGKGSVFTLVFPAAAEKRRDQADTGDRRRAPDAAGAA